MTVLLNATQHSYIQESKAVIFVASVLCVLGAGKHRHGGSHLVARAVNAWALKVTPWLGIVQCPGRKLMYHGLANSRRAMHGYDQWLDGILIADVVAHSVTQLLQGQALPHHLGF